MVKPALPGTLQGLQLHSARLARHQLQCWDSAALLAPKAPLQWGWSAPARLH